MSTAQNIKSQNGQREEKSIILVEDDATYRTRLAKAFEERGLEVEQAESAESFQKVLSTKTFDFAVIDLRVRQESGLDVLSLLLEKQPDCRACMLTGYGTIATSVEAVKKGAVDYLTKPTDPDTILATLRGEAVGSNPEVQTLAQNEWEHIQRVLKDCGGNISTAAHKLGMHRRSLQRKLAKDPGKLR